MSKLLECQCGGTVFTPREEVTITVEAARNARGRGRMVTESTVIVHRCVSCNQSVEDILELLGE